MVRTKFKPLARYIEKRMLMRRNSDTLSPITGNALASKSQYRVTMGCRTVELL